MGLGIRLLMFVLVAFLPVSPCWAQQADTASPQHRVLFLHSYSPEFSWVRDIERGVLEELEPHPEVAYYFEYLDTKHFWGKDYLSALVPSLRYKYATLPLSAVVVSDDNAFLFALEHQQDLFPHTPIVFCGVNDFNPSLRQANPWLTGVEEEVDVAGTLQAALRLRPQAKKLLIITDRTIVGHSTRRLALEALTSLPPTLQYQLLDDATMEEVQQAARSLSADDIILHLIFNIDRNGRMFTNDESLQLVAQESAAPVFGLWDTAIGHGLVGGLLTSGYTQGKEAGSLVRQILFENKAPSTLPVISQSVNRYAFDYRQLTAHGLDAEALPPGSTILFRDPSFYEAHRTLVWTVSAVIVLLTVLVISLLFNIRHRRRVENEIRLLNLHLEERVEERTQSLQQANNNLNRAMDDLQKARGHLVEAEKMAALGGLVSGVAHEINTPVGNSITAASFLAGRTQELLHKLKENQMKRSELEEFLDTSAKSGEIIVGNLNRASELIRTFKQTAVDQQVEEKRLVNMLTYLHEVLLSLRPRLKKTKHTIEIDCPDDLNATIYPGALWQILTNFIMNTLVHAYEPDEAGLIQIAVSLQDHQLTLRYRDNGRGMPEEVQKKVFEPFFTTTRGSGGTGLGLHIVYNLVVFKLKGTILCHSTPGEGTEFIITAPLTPEGGI